MPTSTGTKLGVGLALCILVVGVAPLIMERGIQLGNDEEDGPFLTDEQSDDPRQIECRVTWQTSAERQVPIDVICQVNESEENSMESTNQLTSPWEWFTVANRGDRIYLDAFPHPRRFSEGKCQVFVNGELLDENPFDGTHGCTVDEEVP